MKRVIVYCEGPSEETFINRILAPALISFDVYITATSFGGVSKYSIIRKKLQNLCRSDKSAIITTMLDYYGLPQDTPGYKVSKDKRTDIYDHVEYVEQKMKEDINESNFLPNLVMHEYEALLFSDVQAFSYCALSDRQLSELKSIQQAYPTPEHINNSPNTAPSKRILQIYADYDKVLDGYNIAQNIGLERIKRQCRHFDQWIQKIEHVSMTRVGICTDEID